jgi:hypothetical protein
MKMCDCCYSVGSKKITSHRSRAPTAWLFLMVPLNSIELFTDTLAQAVECPLLGVADIISLTDFSDKKFLSNALFS